jgi:hypothetical protein
MQRASPSTADADPYYAPANVVECLGDVVENARDGMAVAHCISSDVAMGAGIARQLDAQFQIRRQLRQLPDILLAVGNVVEVRRSVRVKTDDNETVTRTTSIFNMITKTTYRDLPTYETMRAALASLRRACDDYDAASHDGRRIGVITMPRIGCGLDKLDWRQVVRLIDEAFSGSKTYVRVHVLPGADATSGGQRYV